MTIDTAADLRIGGADAVVTRNVARTYRVEIRNKNGSPVNIVSLAWWVGGAVDAGDDQGDATEIIAEPLEGDPPASVWRLPVPALTGDRQRLRWVIDGSVAAVGLLLLQRDGQASPADQIPVTISDTVVVLRLEGLPGDTTAADELAQQAAQAAADAQAAAENAALAVSSLVPVEDPPGSGLWTITPAFIEDPPGSGLWSIPGGS